MVDRTYLTDKPPHGPAPWKRALDQRLLPAVIDLAAWGEARAFALERGVIRAPLLSMLLTMLAGVVIGSRCLRARR